mgnify:CR=1 FL=1
MRIEVLETNEGSDLMAGPGDVYAPEISSAGNEFASAIYRHSRLSLRTFESAPLAVSIKLSAIAMVSPSSLSDAPTIVDE